jgi:hypothetical protein
METHVKVIGILYIIFGIIGVLIGSGLLILMMAAGAASQDETAMIITTGIGAFLAAFFGALSLPCIIGGIWLLKRREWARILVLILGFLNLLNIPFGTALGIYTIVILLNDKTAALFKSQPVGTAA